MRHTPKLADETPAMKLMKLYCSAFRTVVAVRIQIWTAVSTYLLVAILKKTWKLNSQ